MKVHVIRIKETGEVESIWNERQNAEKHMRKFIYPKKYVLSTENETKD